MSEERWPGITEGFDSRCTGCCWAMWRGAYQVKTRNIACLVHGGDLSSCLLRIAGTMVPAVAPKYLVAGAGRRSRRAA